MAEVKVVSVVPLNGKNYLTWKVQSARMLATALETNSESVPEMETK